MSGQDEALAAPEAPPPWFRAFCEAMARALQQARPAAPDRDPDVLTAEEVAARLKIQPQSIQNYRRDYPFFRPATDGKWHPHQVDLMLGVIHGFMPDVEAESQWARFKDAQKRRILRAGENDPAAGAQAPRRQVREQR